jgi:hypothetical protein
VAVDGCCRIRRRVAAHSPLSVSLWLRCVGGVCGVSVAQSCKAGDPPLKNTYLVLGNYDLDVKVCASVRRLLIRCVASVADCRDGVVVAFPGG